MGREIYDGFRAGRFKPINASSDRRKAALAKALRGKRTNLHRKYDHPTLQRLLSEAGCTYRQLLDGIRERHATQLLGDASLSRRDVAFLLGYAEQSAFNHAAQRWRAASLAQTIKT